MTFKASTDPDTMYYHQAMREPDKEKFQEAIKKECEDHFRESNYKLVDIKEVPKDAPLLSFRVIRHNVSFAYPNTTPKE